ncbi:MAG: ribosome maturation factor RimP [Lachnospiraceae bacterium]|nr:ribosome maturation factor RimP [Lachnospiraceae bacterium]
MGKHENYEVMTRDLILPILEENNVELYDIDFEKEGSDWYLRVYIDKEGGVDIDDCVNVSRAFNKILDEKDYIEEVYIFEVSSPGLGRQLKKDVHFEKSIGESVDLKTYKPIDKCKEFTGILKSFDANSITLSINDEDKVFIRKEVASVKLTLTLDI